MVSFARIWDRINQPIHNQSLYPGSIILAMINRHSENITGRVEVFLFPPAISCHVMPCPWCIIGMPGHCVLYTCVWYTCTCVFSISVIWVTQNPRKRQKLIVTRYTNITYPVSTKNNLTINNAMYYWLASWWYTMMPCHAMSHHAMSHHTMSCHATSCHITSSHVTSHNIYIDFFYSFRFEGINYINVSYHTYTFRIVTMIYSKPKTIH